VYYTDEFKSYRDLKRFGKHLPVNHSKTFSNGRSHINGIEGFWSFAKHLHAKTRGVKQKYFHHYLAEYEFRYNHRHDNLLALLYERIIKTSVMAKITNNIAMQNN
jgi:transposase